MRRWTVGGMAAAMLIAAAAGVAGAQELGAAAATARIDWSKCGARLECARVRVPLDWDRPDGARITLKVVRHLASRPEQRIGSLFVNFGGPGVVGAATVLATGEFLDTLGDGRFDVVGWDPRGTGESTHVRCFASEAGPTRFWGRDWTIPTTQAESRRYVPQTVAYARRCEALSGALLAHISTKDTVRDLDYLRQLVGDRQLTYRGLSYGAFLGQTYANMFPHRVRAMILDGVVDAVEFTKSVEANIAKSEAESDLVFERFLALCQATGPRKCALAAKGPVEARVRALLQRLRLGPIPARSAPPPRQLRYGDALTAFWLTLGTPSTWPQFAAELDVAADGDGSALATRVRDARAFAQQILVPAVALQCADKPLPRPGAVQAWPKVIGGLSEIAFVAPVDGWWLWAPCASWRTRSADRYTGPWHAATPNPILIIGNRYDSRTAYSNAPIAARRLGNAVLLTLNGYGHTSESDPSVCVDRAVRRYLISTTPPPNGTVCQPDRKPFDPDFGQPLP
jgi:pimeloyl-ACP methyl ester carboxylesterase